MNGRVGVGFGIFVVVLVLLHFVLRVGLGYGQLAPDFLVVAVLLAARQMRAGLAAALGFALGLLDGALVPAALGGSSLALTIIGFAGARSREVFSDDNFLMLALYLFVGKWLFDILLSFGTGGVFRTGASYLLLVSPLTAVYAAAAGLISLLMYRAFA